MYVNPHLQRQYAFLRKSGREVLLVVANFEDRDAMADVVLPQHAFDYLKLRQRRAVEAVDLLTGKPVTLSLQADQPLTLPIAAHAALVLKVVSH